MKENLPPEIVRFLAIGAFVVVGASADRAKYGNKVLRCYLQHGLPVVAVNPRLDVVEGVPCHASLAVVPGPARAVSVIAPPAAASAIVADALLAGVKHRGSNRAPRTLWRSKPPQRPASR